MESVHKLTGCSIKSNFFCIVANFECNVSNNSFCFLCNDFRQLWVRILKTNFSAYKQKVTFPFTPQGDTMLYAKWENADNGGNDKQASSSSSKAS